MTSSDDDADELAVAFRAASPRLCRVAYSILGSYSEAEDVVADCWPSLIAQHRREPVRDVGAWCVVVVARRAVDVLRSARVRREEYVGPWLPEPVVESGGPADPADRVTLDDQVSYALLVVLETLSPAERTSFVLHDLFAMPFDEIAAVVGRTPAAARQLASRARRHVRERVARPSVAPDDHRRVVAAFTAAVVSGDLAALVNALDRDVVLVSDGGGVVTSARRPVVGADKVARFLLGIARRPMPGDAITGCSVNGAPGLALSRAGKIVTVVHLSLDNGRVTRIDMIRAPDKLPRTAD